MPTALITGVAGQDGSYLAELLLENGYRVVGMERYSSTMNYERVLHIQDTIEIVEADLHDQSSLVSLMEEYMPDEVYNLAAQSFVPVSWKQPVLTGEVTALGVTRMLEAIRLVKPRARFYQASSSEMFGKVLEVPQTENTPFYPRSPYGVSKVYGHWITVNYRESYEMYATFRHPLQPREPTPWAGLRHPQDHARGGPHPSGAGQRAAPGQPGSPPRLGLRRRLRAGHVADAAAG